MEKYNEIQISKNEMDFSNRKINNRPFSPARGSEVFSSLDEVMSGVSRHPESCLWDCMLGPVNHNQAGTRRHVCGTEYLAQWTITRQAPGVMSVGLHAWPSEPSYIIRPCRGRYPLQGRLRGKDPGARKSRAWHYYTVRHQKVISFSRKCPLKCHWICCSPMG